MKPRQYMIVSNNDQIKNAFVNMLESNRNWSSGRISNITNDTVLDFVYNIYDKRLWNVKANISNVFDPYHRYFLTNKSQLYKTFLNYNKELANKYMQIQYDVDIEDVKNLENYRHLFDGKKIYILKPTWESQQRGIFIMKYYEQFEKFMKTEGIIQLLDGKKKEGSEADITKYVLAEYLTNQLSINNRLISIRFFLSLFLVNGKLIAYVNKEIIIYKSGNDANFEDLRKANMGILGKEGFIAHSNSEYIDYLVNAIGKDNTQKIIDSIMSCVKHIYDIIIETKCIKNYGNVNHSYDIFGLDFIIDREFNVKLVELNDRISVFKKKDVIYDSFASCIISNTINKLYEEEYRIKLDKSLRKEYKRLYGYKYSDV